MVGVKFFIYGKGSWHEVDVNSGKIVGWRGRAKFLYARQGRLHAAKSERVLRALRDLAAGKPSPAQYGLRLSQKLCYNNDSCKSIDNDKIDTSTQCETKVNASTQIDDNITKNKTTQQRNLRIKLVRTNLDENEEGTTKTRNEQLPNGTHKTFNKDSENTETSEDSLADFVIKKKNAPIPPTLRSKNAIDLTMGSSDSEVNFEVQAPKRRRILRSTPVKKKLKRRLKDVSSDDDRMSLMNGKLMERKKVSHEDKEGKLTERNKDDSDAERTSPVKKILMTKKKVEIDKKKSKRDKIRSTPVKRRSREQTIDVSSDTDQNIVSKTVKKSKADNKLHSSDSEDSNATYVLETNKNKSKKHFGHKSYLTTSDSDTDTQIQNAKAIFNANQNRKRRSRSESRSPRNVPLTRRRAVSNIDGPVDKTRHASKKGIEQAELVIPEEHVVILRGFIEKTDCADLEKFDSDDNYKRILFYAINPLVEVEKCAVIEKLLDDQNLKKFAARLGLCSVSEVSTQASPPYKTRNRTKSKDRTALSEDSDTDKENHENTSRTKDIDNKRSPRKVSSREKSRDKRERSPKNDMRREKSRDNRERSHRRVSSREKSRANRENSDNTLNDSKNTSLDRVRYKGRYIKSKVIKSIERIAKYNANYNNTNEDRIEKKLEENNNGTTLKADEFLNSKKFRKLLTRSLKDTSQKENNTDQNQNRSRMCTVVLDKVIPEQEKEDKPVDFRKKLRSSNVIDDSLEKTEIDNRRDKSSNRAKATEKEGTSKDTNENQVLKTRSSHRSGNKNETNCSRREKTGTDHSRDKSNRTKVNEKEGTSKGTNENQVLKTRSSDKSSNKNDDNSRSRALRSIKDTHSIEKVSEKTNKQKENGKKVSSQLEFDESNKNLSTLSRSSHTISKRVYSFNLKEYSNLEDHAIVAFVSVGNRGRIVNGNRLWKELQEQYKRLTGIDRSWHSLRNRYLRYILPSLGMLGLPPSQAAQLRAAAATGEIKAKKLEKVQRRNSIFDKDGAARGAATRLRLKPTSPARIIDTTEQASPLRPSPRKSPRYSDVTRQFASRKLRSTPRDSPTETTETTESHKTVKTRKLFNPKMQ